MENKKPKFYLEWLEAEGGACKDCILVRTQEFTERSECQDFVASIHKREGYQRGSLRIHTGFDIPTERG